MIVRVKVELLAIEKAYWVKPKPTHSGPALLSALNRLSIGAAIDAGRF